MGLFGKRRRRNRVRGTARVISVTAAPPQTIFSNLAMELVVEAPGIPAFNHSYTKFAVRVAKWPSPGSLLPVAIDPDGQRLDVLWDEVPNNSDVARRQAEQTAEMQRQRHAGPGDAPSGAVPTSGGPIDPIAGTIVDQLQQMFPGAEVTIEGDPAMGDGPAAAPVPGASLPGSAGPVDVVAGRSDADPVERLEKLARLRQAGIIDEAQFQQLKTQILGQAGVDGP